MQDMEYAFQIFVIGVSSVFLIMLLLMLVLQVFGAIVRYVEGRRGETEKLPE
jgi:Na+-transporting methylmalonyl-CoA/oxaloacetate decarboxylase gamma subunit